MDILIFLNKYHGEFVDKTDDGYILPVVDLDRLQKTTNPDQKIEKKKTRYNKSTRHDNNET